MEVARNEIARLHAERDHYEETMKKAFMRGVCALNLEAMSMFREGEEGGRGPPPPAANPNSGGEIASGACKALFSLFFCHRYLFILNVTNGETSLLAMKSNIFFTLID